MAKAKLQITLDIEAEYPDTMKDDEMISFVSAAVAVNPHPQAEVKVKSTRKGTKLVAKMDWVTINNVGFPTTR